METCDSHTPHDLGGHINEDGQKKINGHLMGATRALAELLQLETVQNDDVLEFTSKWIMQSGRLAGALARALTPAPARGASTRGAPPRRRRRGVGARPPHYGRAAEAVILIHLQLADNPASATK